MQGKILVVSDIHGNIHALERVVESVRGWDRIVVLGDLVDYGPRPAEVIDYLREHDALIVRGNHDHAVAYGVDCRCGEKTHWLSVWFRENITSKLLDEGDKEFLARLPTRENADLGSIKALLVHAAPRNPLYSYLHPWLGDEEVCSMLRPSARLRGRGRGCDGVSGVYLVGHTHIQFLRTVNGALVVNPGSVGQPRDGDPRAAYAVIDGDGRVAFGRVKYDVDPVIRDLEALGIKGPYLEALKVMLREGRVPNPPPGVVRG